jgi:glutathione S-transferase
MMKLYDSKLALNPRRVRIFLAEKGISVPIADIDLARLGAAFSVLNPFQIGPRSSSTTAKSFPNRRQFVVI